MAPDFRAESKKYAADGWTTHPLRLNSEGFPKVAIVERWQDLTPDSITTLPWDSAAGIGIVLGASSGNLGVIDVDDGELAADVVALLVRQHKNPLMAWTARGRCHIYCVEPKPSSTRKLRLEYQGRPVLVELRSSGAYCALPPSPGYTWANRDWEPLYSTLTDAWHPIAAALGVTWPNDVQVSGAAGYPKPWQPAVGQGERNDSLFVEACRLADAGMGEREALDVMLIRFRTAYQQGAMGQREIERTVRSAYRHVANNGKQRAYAHDPGVVGAWSR